MEQEKVSYDISNSSIVIEQIIKRYGISSTTEPYQVRQIEQEIILEGLRLQNRNKDW